MTPDKMENHEISLEYDERANLFPMGPEHELKELAGSIGANGLQVPIVLLNGKILDGRRRSRACEMAGVEPRYEQFPVGQDPYEFVAAMNLHRRHLDKSQRAIIAEKMATMKRGRYSESGKSTDPWISSRKAAATIMGVGTTSIDSVRRTRKNGVPEVVEALEKGLIAVDAANRIATLPKEKQAAALAEKTAPRHVRQERAAKVVETPTKSELEKPVRYSIAEYRTHQGGRLSSEQIAELEAKINAPSICPEDLPLPIHPKAHLTAHIQEREAEAARPLAKDYKCKMPRNLKPGLIATLHLLFAEKDPELAARFCSEVVQGASDRGTPAREAREWIVSLEKGEVKTNVIAAVLIDCWNRECRGENVTRIRIPKNCPEIASPASKELQLS